MQYCTDYHDYNIPNICKASNAFTGIANRPHNMSATSRPISLPPKIVKKKNLNPYRMVQKVILKYIL